jgi:hypothetical protein
MLSMPSQTHAADSLKAAGTLQYWDASSPEIPIYVHYRGQQNIESVRAGQGYWYRPDRPVTAAISSDELFSGTSFSVNLQKSAYGWNQVGSAYIYPVQWPDSLAAVWRWNPQTRDYEDAGGVLEPWLGYWVHSDIDTAMVVNGEPVFPPAEGLTKKARAFFAGRDQWQIQISLHSEVNADADNRIGLAKEALDGFDRLDAAEPPRSSGNPYLFIAHPEWGRTAREFSRDIRQSLGKGAIYNLGIAPANPQIREITLTFDGAGSVQSTYFFLGKRDSIAPLESNTPYAVEPSVEEQYYNLYASNDRNFLAQFPLKFRMGSPYPNPFHPMVNITYTLPYRWENNGMLVTNPYRVNLVIIDAMGRQVRNLVQRTQGPGNYHVTWDGRSNSGRPVATGAYFCWLVADKLSGVKMMTLVK